MIEQTAIKISGKDVFKFLQGQLTCDMKDITETLHPGALCNNKGRVIVSFEIKKENHFYLIYLPKIMANIFLKNLEKYAKFSEVNLEKIVLDLPPIDLLESIRNKCAIILPETSEFFTPHELNYHELNFISFTKGCYKGQEIIARMHYLGKLKKQLSYQLKDSLENAEGTIVNYVKYNNKYEILAVVKPL